MTLPVVIHPVGDQFIASLIGAPELRGEGDTRDQAIQALREQLDQRVVQGELVSIDIPFGPITALAGKYKEDPTLQDICMEAYHERDLADLLLDSDTDDARATMLASEAVLRRDWDRPEEDAAWAYL